MRKTLSSILLSFLFCCCTIEAQEDFSSWIRNMTTPTDGIQADKCCKLLLRSALSDRTVVSVAPDNQRYAVLLNTSKRQIVRIHTFDNEQPLTVYKNIAPKPNLFSPLDILWSPDGDRLFVKYGYTDIGNGFWFPHDASTGTMIGDKEYYQRLATTSTAERTDPLRHDGPLPVWTVGGKQYENETAARKAGHKAFFSPNLLRKTYQSVTHIDWRDGKKYRLFLDPNGNHWLAYVIADGELIDTLQVNAPMFQRVLFTYKDNELYAKVLPQTGRPATTVFFGEMKLVRVTDLGTEGLLVRSIDKNFSYWQILNPREAGECRSKSE